MHLFHLYYEICCLFFMKVILKCWVFFVCLFFCTWSWVKFVAVLNACGNSFHIFICLKNMSSPFYSFGTIFCCARGIPYNIDPRFSSYPVLIPWITIVKSANLKDALGAIHVVSTRRAVISLSRRSSMRMMWEEWRGVSQATGWLRCWLGECRDTKRWEHMS